MKYGKTYYAPVFYIGRQHIIDFAKLINSKDKASLDLAEAHNRGLKDLVAPATFAVFASQKAEMLLLFDKDLNINFKKLVHASQSFKYLIPLMAGDEIYASAKIKNIKQIQNNIFLTVLSTLKNQKGQVAVEIESAYFIADSQLES